MHVVRVVTCVVLITSISSSSITTSPLIVKSKKLTVLGAVTEEMDADANPAWSIQLNPVIMVHGRQISSVEIKSPTRENLVRSKTGSSRRRVNSRFLSVSKRSRVLSSSFGLQRHESEIVEAFPAGCSLFSNCKLNPRAEV